MEMNQAYPVLQCNGLFKRYGAKVALNGISFSVPAGRILGLLGPNGSGKTTLIKLTAGLLVPGAGEVLVCGSAPGIESKRVVSYLPDRNFLDGDITFRACCKLFADFFEDFETQRAMYLLKDLQIDPDQRFKTLSKGNREKVQLILVMSRRAQLYLLDEPIAGVDPATRDYILNTIIANRNPSSTVIVSTHLIQDVEPVLDDVLFIKSGNIALYDSAAHVREQYGKSVDEVFREIYAYHPGAGQEMYMAGAPVQGMPVQGMPVQGMPMQGMPVQAAPMQGAPIQEMSIQGAPVQGTPMQEMPVQGAPMQGALIQDTPMQGTSTQGMPLQGPPPQNTPPQNPEQEVN